MKPRFIVIKNATGCIMILDSTKKEGETGRAVAHFFYDAAKPDRAKIRADMCAKHLNEEAAKWTAKTAEQGSLTE